MNSRSSRSSSSSSDNDGGDASDGDCEPDDCSRGTVHSPTSRPKRATMRYLMQQEKRRIRWADNPEMDEKIVEVLEYALKTDTTVSYKEIVAFDPDFWAERGVAPCNVGIHLRDLRLKRKHSAIFNRLDRATRIQLWARIRGRGSAKSAVSVPDWMQTQKKECHSLRLSIKAEAGTKRLHPGDGEHDVPVISTKGRKRMMLNHQRHEGADLAIGNTIEQLHLKHVGRDNIQAPLQNPLPSLGLMCNETPLRTSCVTSKPAPWPPLSDRPFVPSSPQLSSLVGRALHPGLFSASTPHEFSQMVVPQMGSRPHYPPFNYQQGALSTNYLSDLDSGSSVSRVYGMPCPSSQPLAYSLLPFSSSTAATTTIECTNGRYGRASSMFHNALMGRSSTPGMQLESQHVGFGPADHGTRHATSFGTRQSSHYYSSHGMATSGVSMMGDDNDSGLMMENNTSMFPPPLSSYHHQHQRPVLQNPFM